jgi:hypothetical protein
MLNFAEQTGSGAVIVVWSLTKEEEPRKIKYSILNCFLYKPFVY